MGLFDYLTNTGPYQGGLLGALGMAGSGRRSLVNEQPDDIMNPINDWGAVSQGHAPLSALLGRGADMFLPPLNGGAQQPPWAQPPIQQPQPAPMAQPAPMGAPAMA